MGGYGWYPRQEPSRIIERQGRASSGQCLGLAPSLARGRALALKQVREAAPLLRGQPFARDPTPQAIFESSVSAAAAGALDVGANTDDDSGKDQYRNSRHNQTIGLFAGSLPFVKDPAPHGAEDDDARHVQCP